MVSYEVDPKRPGMMRMPRPTYYIDYVDATGKRATIKGPKDREAAEAMARRLEKESGVPVRGWPRRSILRRPRHVGRTRSSAGSPTFGRIIAMMSIVRTCDVSSPRLPTARRAAAGPH
jgi:hypothetical protein